MPRSRNQPCTNITSSSSSASSAASSGAGLRTSKRTRRPVPSGHFPPASRTYPRGPPVTAEERLFFTLNAIKVAACSLVAADDIIAPLFNDPRSGLYVRTVGSHRLSVSDSRLLYECFGTALPARIDPDYPTGQAEAFTKRMKVHGIVNVDKDEGDAFSNLSLRYSRLKHSPLVRISSATINGCVEIRIVAKVAIPRGTLMLELGGIMSADAIEYDNKNMDHGKLNRRRRNTSLIPAFKMFSVIWRANEQCGPGPRKDRLLLGPARFINHSCTPNCKLIPFPKTNAWGVETSKDVQEGEEITVSYGDHYFEPGECACTSCADAPKDISESKTPATSLAPSPTPSCALDELHTNTTAHGVKRRRTDSDALLDESRLTKKKRR